MASNDKQKAPAMTEAEAQEVHGWFIRGFSAFVFFAIVAHALVWMWRPWITPG